MLNILCSMPSWIANGKHKTKKSAHKIRITFEEDTFDLSSSANCTFYTEWHNQNVHIHTHIYHPIAVCHIGKWNWYRENIRCELRFIHLSNPIFRHGVYLKKNCRKLSAENAFAQHFVVHNTMCMCISVNFI